MYILVPLIHLIGRYAMNQIDGTNTEDTLDRCSWGEQLDKLELD